MVPNSFSDSTGLIGLEPILKKCKRILPDNLRGMVVIFLHRSKCFMIRCWHRLGSN